MRWCQAIINVLKFENKYYQVIMARSPGCWTHKTENKTWWNKIKITRHKTTNKAPCSRLTYCGVSDEGLPVGHHGVHSHLLVILARDDRYGGLSAVPVPSPDQSEPFIMSADQSEAVLTWESAWPRWLSPRRPRPRPPWWSCWGCAPAPWSSCPAATRRWCDGAAPLNSPWSYCK